MSGLVLLHSKYSENCKRLFRLLEGVPLNLQTLCIDNKVVNQRIRNSKLDIKQVPCILLSKPDNTIEKYEGQVAFQWADDVLQQFHDQQPPQPQQLPPQPQPQPQPQQPPPQPQQPHHRRLSPVEELTSEEEYEEPVLEEEEYVPPSPPRQRGKNLKKKKIQKTAVEELPLDDTDTDLMGTETKSIPKRIQASPNGDFIEDSEMFSGEQPTEPDQITSIRNRNNKKKQSSGIMQAAQEMQKLRETADPKKNKQLYN